MKILTKNANLLDLCNKYTKMKLTLISYREQRFLRTQLFITYI